MLPLLLAFAYAAPLLLVPAALAAWVVSERGLNARERMLQGVPLLLLGVLAWYGLGALELLGSRSLASGQWGFFQQQLGFSKTVVCVLSLGATLRLMLGAAPGRTLRAS